MSVGVLLYMSRRIKHQILQKILLFLWNTWIDVLWEIDIDVLHDDVVPFEMESRDEYRHMIG